MKSSITYLGKIIRVDTNSIEVEISDEIPSAAPIIEGKIYKLGQIGTFVKIPVGTITLFGVVSLVSNTPIKIDENNEKPIHGGKYLTVQLVGEKIGDEDFERGVGIYPTIDDEVHIVTEKDLHLIYQKADKGSFEVGRHSSSESLPVYADIHNFILRHSGIFGSTGSGKSNTTVGIVKSIITGFDNSRIILVDPHGEYSSAFEGNANIFKINDDVNPLCIPFWLMNFEEMAVFLVGAKPNEEAQPQYRRLREFITDLRKENCQKLKAGNISPEYVTADSPIPFNVKKLWHELNWWLNASFNTANKDLQIKDNAWVVEEGDYKDLKSTKFKDYLDATGGKTCFKSTHQEFFSYEKRIKSKINDSRYDFMFNPPDYVDSDSTNDIDHLLRSWIGADKRLTILDLSGVPFDLLDISVGLITRFIFESMMWGRQETYTGKNRPLLIAYEESHTYLSKNPGDLNNTNYAKNAVERVLKEGRKFGLGTMIISQRPSEISETILSQIGTFIALRLTNASDKNIIKASASDNMSSLVDLLPSLRTGEAIIVGESIKVPSRIRIKLNVPRPDSSDPKLAEIWSKKQDNSGDYKKVIKALREQKKRR